MQNKKSNESPWITKRFRKNKATCEIGQIPYTVNEPYDEVVDKEIKCD